MIADATQGPLIGRRHELRTIDRTLGALERRAVALELAGEPGIGKTCLVTEACDRASRQGLAVLRGRAAHFEGDVPFAVLVDALDDHLAALPARALERLRDDRRAELARIFPALKADGPRVPLVQDERYRSHYAVRSLLEALAARGPVLLALDDLHWADDASLEVVAHLLRRPPAAPVGLLLVYRSGQAPLLLRSALARPAPELATVRLTLQPLERAESLALAAGRVDERIADELHEQSGGNPFYLEQLLRTAGAARAPATVVGPVSGGVPQAVVDALTEEVARLTPRARLVLDGAAVAGDPFEPEIAAAAAGLDEGETLDALDELLTGDLVRATGGPRRFRFRHPIVRRAVYDAAPAGWRLKAHGRVAAALGRIGAPAGLRAHHVEQSAARGDLEAVDLLAATGHEVAPRAPAAAAHWFAAALRLLPAADERRLTLLVPLATALGAAGRLEESRDALRETLALVDPGAAALRARIVAFVALIEGLLGHREAGRSLLLETLAAVPAGSAEAAGLMLELAADCFYRNDDAGQIEWAQQAQDVAAELGDSLLRAEASALVALGHYGLGDRTRAEDHYAAVTGIVDRLDDSTLAGRLTAVFFVGWYGHTTEHFADTVRFMDRGLAISRTTGQGHLLVPMMIGKAIALTWQGSLGAAAEVADDALEIARLSRNDQSLAWTLTLRCWIATLSGDLTLALRCGEEALETVERLDDTYYSALTHCYLAETRLECGEPERCRAAIVGASGGLDLLAIELSFRAHFYEILCRAELALGDVDAAHLWAQRAEAAAASCPIAGRLSAARRARAAILLAQRRPAEAAAAARASLEAAQRCGARIDAERARILLGRAAAMSGDKRGAIDAHEHARRVLQGLGATRLRDEAARELRRLGRRVRRPGSNGGGHVAGLSEREYAVSRLVAAGKTNRVIGSELHVSEKTVEKHVSRAFEKLGVRTRAELAAAVTRAEARADEPL